MLESLNRRPEDIRVHAVIIAELDLGDIERKVLLADLVEGADATALDERPEAFNGVGMDRANHVLALTVIRGRVGEFLVPAFPTASDAPRR